MYGITSVLATGSYHLICGELRLFQICSKFAKFTKSKFSNIRYTTYPPVGAVIYFTEQKLKKLSARSCKTVT